MPAHGGFVDFPVRREWRQCATHQFNAGHSGSPEFFAPGLSCTGAPTAP
jgi:hypothetical protein